MSINPVTASPLHYTSHFLSGAFASATVLRNIWIESNITFHYNFPLILK